MKVNLEKIEKNVVALEIEVAQEKFSEAVEKAFRKLAPKVNVPGFRKGKAPRVMIERKLGREYIWEEAMDFIVPEAYFEALQETKIDPIDRPKVEVVQMEDDKPFIFKATVEVRPEVNLGQYIGLEAEKPAVEVTDGDVDKELQKLQERHAQLVPVEDGAAEMHDITVIDFEGFVDGVAFPGGKGTDYSLELGSGSFIPGFEEQLVGAKVGEEREVNVTFPENYHSADLAGKEAMFKVAVKGIKRKELAALDDEFAKDVSEFESLEELKTDIRNKLEKEAERKADHTLKDELVNKAVGGSEVEVPETMIEQRIDSMLQDMNQRLGMQGLSIEDYLKYSGTTVDEFRKNYRERAEKEIRVDLVLDAIAKAENIEVTEEDIDNRVKEMAEQYKQEPATLRQWLENGGNMEPLKKSVVIDKTVDFLVEKAKLA
ncbi:MAG: trigger factor [Bacillota bacterium]